MDNKIKNTKEWYYKNEGKQIGPVVVGEIKVQVEAGDLSYGDMVWKKGSPAWIKLEDSDLKHLLADQPPPLPMKKVTNVIMKIIESIKNMKFVESIRNKKLWESMKTKKAKIIMISLVLLLLIIGLIDCGDASETKIASVKKKMAKSPVMSLNLLRGIATSDKTKKLAIKEVRDDIFRYESQELFLELGHNKNVYQKWLAQKKTPKAEKILKQLKSKVNNLAIKLKVINCIEGSSFIQVNATLKIDGRKLDVTYYIDLNRDVRIAGSIARSLSSIRNRKVIPYSKIIEKRATEFRKEYYKNVKVSPRGEFETYQEHNKRKARAKDIQKIKAYTNLAKNGGLTNIYELKLGKLDDSYFRYHLYNKKLIFDIKPGSYKLKSILKQGQIKVIDIFGYLIYGASCQSSRGYSGNIFDIYETPVSQAKMIKKKLGNTWKVEHIKIWLKFDYSRREWTTVKLFVLPNTSIGK